MRYAPHYDLPEKRFLPGQGPGKSRKSFHGWKFPECPAFLPITSWEENAFYLYGIDLFNHGYFWEAHEVWGESFRAARGLDKTQMLYFQSLVQIAAAFLHLLGKNRKAAQATSQKAVNKLQKIIACQGNILMGNDLDKFKNHTIKQIQDPSRAFSNIALSFNQEIHP